MLIRLGDPSRGTISSHGTPSLHASKMERVVWGDSRDALLMRGALEEALNGRKKKVMGVSQYGSYGGRCLALCYGKTVSVEAVTIV